MKGNIGVRRERATRFFWAVLIAASSASVAGNVAHALLDTNAGNRWVAAIAAVIPPAVLLAATHGLALMVRTSITGTLYRYAVALLVGLAVCAFVLSFNALSELAMTQGGMPQAIAYMWPLAIDFSVAQSTLALLAITTGKRARSEVSAAERQPRKRATTPRRKPMRPKSVPNKEMAA